jgi:hypothetical protein
MGGPGGGGGSIGFSWHAVMYLGASCLLSRLQN